MKASSSSLRRIGRTYWIPLCSGPGRFDRRVVVSLPDVKGREGILKVHTTRIPLASDVDLSILARGTPGILGSQIWRTW